MSQTKAQIIDGHGDSTFNTDTLAIDGTHSRVGVGETAPGTQVEVNGDEPYITIKNSTEEDTDGGRESKIIFEGEQSGGEISTLGQIEVSHDGADDDEKGKIVFSTNDGADGSAPTTALTIDSGQNVTVANGLTTDTLTVNSGLTVDTVNNQSFPPFVSNHNLIDNPTFTWSTRSYSNGISQNGVKACDRWAAKSAAEGNISQRRITLTSSDTPYTSDDSARFALRTQNKTTVLNPGTGASEYFYIRQNVNGYAIRHCGWDYTDPNSKLTFSFWARSSVTQTFHVYFYSSDSLKLYNKSFDLVADTWKLVSVTIPGHADLDFISTTSARFYIYISQFWGTNYTNNTVPDGSWIDYDSGNRAPDMTNTWAATTDATFDITNAKLEVGSQRTKFIYPDPMQELELMQYYCRIIADGVHFPVGMAAYYTSGAIYMQINLGKRMRSSPTAYIEPGDNYYDAYRRGAADSIHTPALSGNARPWCVEFAWSTGDGASGTAGDACFIRTDNTNALIYLESEIS